jgi:hypothetical protein
MADGGGGAGKARSTSHTVQLRKVASLDRLASALLNPQAYDAGARNDAFLHFSQVADIRPRNGRLLVHRVCRQPGSHPLG